MGYFSVIDTGTNREDQVMSISTVIADADTFHPVAAKYHILPEECFSLRELYILGDP